MRQLKPLATMMAPAGALRTVGGGPLTDAELRGITEHALAWAQRGHKITNRTLAVFADLDSGGGCKVALYSPRLGTVPAGEQVQVIGEIDEGLNSRHLFPPPVGG